MADTRFVLNINEYFGFAKFSTRKTLDRGNREIK